MEHYSFALDCNGGDYAPLEIVRGGILASKEFGYKLFLVGDGKKIEAILRKSGELGNPLLEVVDAPENVGFQESPSSVLKKKNSSLYVGAKLVREGKAQGLISAGNTGAVLAVGKFIVGAEEEVERPAIAVALPNPKGKTVLIDVGANVDSKPRHLVQFAVIGHTYAQEILGIKNPRVGLLSIGEEEGKGNELVKETYPLLKQTGLNFLGNAEGRDIYAGTFDVIVCDGFVGNIILKASESLGLAVVQMIKEEIKKSLLAKFGAFLLLPALNSFRKKADFTEYGGIPLLGAKKPVIITHGKANAKAIKNAIKVAGEFLSHDFNVKLVENIRELIPEEVRV
ncbi:phosphate:acyl-[acyl carrier protein] acyltransferase [Hydrogenivirga caldilitoris]|uniref:Phosphate acyltransferase n=1 Tax=Hydrogenivirga caldilitoris TaxID=246264 RepID=A0A497XS39_9AQUI|nr:phosphate acyltransferase PlsX [Hydrogenivirga caldilitoris]RLJ69952.1 phosphate:acyl-[acyl carrier protein] acyltransferase [Hydrogenivirga caldilitoris]